MGAVSSLIYASKNQMKIQCMVLDSPFANLKKILVDFIDGYKILPSFIAEYSYKKAREQIQKKLHFDIEEVNPILAAANCKVPVVFIHGAEDGLVDISHSKNLINIYEGEDKVLIEVANSDHNASRPV